MKRPFSRAGRGGGSRGWARPPSGAGRRRHHPRALPRAGPRTAAPRRRLRRAGLAEQPRSLRGGRRGAMWLLWLLLGSAGECGRGRCPGALPGSEGAAPLGGGGRRGLPATPASLGGSWRAGGAAGRSSPGCSRRSPLPSPPQAGCPRRGARRASRPLRPSGRARAGPGPRGGERGWRGARRNGAGSGAAAVLGSGTFRPNWASKSPPGRRGRGCAGTSRGGPPSPLRPSARGLGAGYGQVKRSGRAWLYLGCRKGVSYFPFISICIETLSRRHMPVKIGE